MWEYVFILFGKGLGRSAGSKIKSVLQMILPKRPSFLPPSLPFVFLFAFPAALWRVRLITCLALGASLVLGIHAAVQQYLFVRFLLTALNLYFSNAY